MRLSMPTEVRVWAYLLRGRATSFQPATDQAPSAPWSGSPVNMDISAFTSFLGFFKKKAARARYQIQDLGQLCTL